MCDYSLHSVKSRPAKVGDKLTARFWYGHARVRRVRRHEPSSVRPSGDGAVFCRRDKVLTDGRDSLAR